MSLFSRAGTLLLALACLLGPAFATGIAAKGKAGSSPTPKPNIIIITLDTTRADRMDFLGSERGLTPNLDTLANDGVVFTRAYSHVPLTPPSHATILTGTYPQYNHVTDFGSKLPADVPYLPDVLRKQGYKTAAFISSIILDPVQGSGPGFDRGFDLYDSGFHHRRLNEDRYESIERRAEVVVAHATAWLDKHPQGPKFLWLHFYDAHDPYDPPEPFKTKYANALYDGEIAYTDSAVGKFFDYLRKRGLYDNSVIAVMADHGESLGAHGETAHGVFLYDETIRVPLVVKLPAEHSAGKQVETRAVLVDVAPTVLQAAGIAIPKQVQGKSLLPAIKAATEGKTGPDQPAFAQTDYPRRAFGFSSVKAWRSGKYLYVKAPRQELYDQPVDPAAAHDLAEKSNAVADTLRGQLDDFRKKIKSATAAPKGPVDPQQQEKLSALGYVAGDSANDDADDDVKIDPTIVDTKADPKDKIQTVNLLHDAILLGEDHKYEQSVPLLEKVKETDPGIPITYSELGMAYSWLEEFEKAIPVLRKAVELRPDAMMPQYNLGLALSRTDDWAGSVEHFEVAVKKAPKWAALHFSLAAAYARVERPEDAKKELRTLLSLEPDDYRGNLILGRMLSLEGKSAQGLPYLKKAVKVQPKAPDAHAFLADAYGRMGQIPAAKREAAESDRLRAAGERGPQ